jgi:SAM-dependent methyltransferase
LDTIESSAIKILERTGIMRGQTVLDFGCGYGAYTIPVAKVVGEQGRVYALDKDKEALNTLMQKAGLEGLENIEKIETSGELETKLDDESVDAVLLFNVLHSFYLPNANDRRRLLIEIRRVMKRFAFLAVSIWPNLVEPGTVDEVKSADFRLEKDIPEGVDNDKNNPGICKILNFRKEWNDLSLINQSKRRYYEQDSRSYGLRL